MRSYYRRIFPKFSLAKSARREVPARRKPIHLSALLLLLVLTTVFFSLPCSTIHAYEKKPATYIKNATAHLKINSDGTINVMEQIRFHSDRTLKSLTLVLLSPLKGESILQSLEIAQVIHGEEEKFIQVPEGDERRPQPFSYRIERLKDRLRIRLSMTAFTGEYVFRLNYDWTRGVVEKDNHAFISGPLCAAPSGMRVETLLWNITFPDECSVDFTEIVPIGYHTMTENRTGSNTVSFIDNRPFIKTDDMGIVISAPKRYFSLILPTGDEVSLKESFAKARALSTRITFIESLRDSVMRIIMILTVTGLLVYLIFQGSQLIWNCRRKPDFAVWPVSARPAQVALLASTSPREPDILLATVLSLVARREISWTDEVFIWNNPNRNDFSQFTTYETLLLQWLFAAKPEYDHVLSPGRLRIVARHGDFRQLAQRFKKHVETDFEKSRLVEPRLTKVFRHSYFVLAFLFLIPTVGFFLYTKSALSFITLIVSILFVLSGFTFRFLTFTGARRAHDTQCFKRALKTPELLVQSAAEHFTDVEMMIGTLPVAVALNRASVYLESIKDLDSPLFERAAYALLHVFRGLPVPADLDAEGEAREPYEKTLLKRALSEMERGIASWRELFRSCFL